jgi:hypothetical protein
VQFINEFFNHQNEELVFHHVVVEFFVIGV